MHSQLIIGGIKVDNPLFLAPLAGVSLSAVRGLFRKLGVALTHTEMISSTGLIYGGTKTWHMLDYTEEEKPLVIQLFAGDADSLCRSAELCLKEHSYAGFSINMACPMPKITKRGAGSALLQFPGAAAEMVRRLKGFGLPVWPKIRKIVPDSMYPLNTIQFSEDLLEAGADNVTIHGRTPAQRYEGSADRDEVLGAARRFPGLITASGDVYSPQDVKNYLDGGCVAVIAARGAMANPFMVVQSLRLLGYNTRLTEDEPSLEERADILIDFADSLHRLHAERIALVLLKRFISGFFRGQQGTTEFKRTLAVTKDWNSTYSLLLDWRSYFERGIV